MSFLRLIHCTPALIATAVTLVSGCSDPVDIPQQGAFTATIGGATCPYTTGRNTISVGEASSHSKTTIADGEAGITVSCRVTADGDTLSLQASIQNGGDSLFIQGTASRSASGTATVSLTGGGLPGPLVMPTGQTCKLTLVDGAAGKMWAAFECETLDVKSQPDSSCRLTDGWVVVENCES